MTVNKLRNRINSLDILRGLVIVLMAIDHVRDAWSMTAFQPEDLTQTTPGYFFTRWITHFCAPVFVFLAGTSCYLYQQKINDKLTLSLFLLKRGIWLIFIEIIFINWSWSWNFFWNQWGFFLQVIWAIGVSMVFMSALIWLSDRILLILSLLMIFSHNIFNYIVPGDFVSFGWIWKIVHESGWIAFNSKGSFGVFIAYPIIPWVGVMGAGYVFGRLMMLGSRQRIKILFQLGIACISLFIVLRYLNIYGDTSQWQSQNNAMYTLMSFINTQKYPPSLLFLLMTLGPSFLLLIVFEKKSYIGFKALQIFGRVPFFFYIFHFMVIHFTSQLYFRLFYGQWFDVTVNGRNPKLWPEFYQPSLLRLYLAWALIIILFYFLCKWFDQYKSTHKYWWLKYL